MKNRFVNWRLKERNRAHFYSDFDSTATMMVCVQEAQLGVDKIIDALDIMETEEERKLEPGYQPNVMLLGLSGSEFLLQAVSSIRANDLETACVSLSFTDALILLKMVPPWIESPLNVRPKLTIHIWTF